MARHTQRHIALATVTGINLSSADTKVLQSQGKWKTDQELQDWFDLHQRLHSAIDKKLNL